VSIFLQKIVRSVKFYIPVRTRKISSQNRRP